MSTTAEHMTAITGRISLEQAHDALVADRVKRELYSQQDDVADWAAVNATSLRLGLADRRFAELAEQEHHDRVVAESFKHFAGCRGSSCKQGRLPCRERCSAEMACPADDDHPKPPRRSRWSRLARDMWRWLCGAHP